LLPAVLQYAWYEPLKDWYAAYNKPGAVVDYFEHNSPKEEWVVVLDSDMLLKTPFKVRMESSSGGDSSMSIQRCLGGWRGAVVKPAARAFRSAHAAQIWCVWKCRGIACVLTHHISCGSQHGRYQ
jgi:hypothetical protein